MAFHAFRFGGPRPFAMPFFGEELEAMFGGRFGGPEEDGGIEGTFANIFDYETFGPGAAFFEAAFQPQEQEHRQPATAETFLRSMPVLRVTNNDIEEENDECTICFDKMSVGDAAMRIPCGHLFHEDCVRKWLESSNMCPVCRYELPTDDVAFENDRRVRMMNRRPRLRVKDLSVKSVKELRHLAGHLGVCIEGCLEKPELVDAIIESGRVEVVPVGPKAPLTESTSSVEPSNSTCSLQTLALPAIADGEPIIQSFLGGCPSLAALTKIPLVVSKGESMRDTGSKSASLLVNEQHPSSNVSADV